MLNSINFTLSTDTTSVSQNLLLHAIDEPVCIIDKNEKIIFVNNPLLNLFGYHNDELLENNFKILLDTGEEKKLETIFTISDDEIWKVPLKHTKKNGEQFSSLAKSLHYYIEGEELYLILLQKPSKARVKDSAELFKDKFITLFYEIKDAIYESSPDGKMLDINPAGVELFGFDTKKELLSVSIAENLYVNPADRILFKERLERFGYVKDYEIEIKKKNGSILTVIETGFSVKDNQGNVTAYRGILRDITEIKNNQKELRKYVDELAEVNKQLVNSEKELKNLNDSKDKLFSIVAHDLRSPFTSLIGYSQFLREDIDSLSKEEIQTFATNINESSKIVFALLENLLQWSRIQTGRIVIEPISFDISILADQAIRLLRNNAENKNLSVINGIPRDSLVFADEQTISSVIQNLLSNAIKFTQPGGIVKLEGFQKADAVGVSVTDNGVGIEKDDLINLFRIDNHHTTNGTQNEIGSGLGLILCKELIEKNGGQIWAESKKGEGSKFSFTLPAGTEV